jgi:CRP-like cAMP-binding protein
MNYNLLIKHKLAGFYMFSELQTEQIEKLANGAKLLKHHRGEMLFNRGDQAQGFYILLEGQIKLGVTSPQGDEKILGLVQPGQSFGEAVLFLERSFPVSAHATIDSEVLLVNKDAIFEILDNDTTVARRMLAGISACNRQLVNDIESISLQNSAQRLIGYLLQISAESPEPDRIQLPANKVTIASMLNITPETFSRVILKLQNAGLIEVSGRQITIANHNGLLNYK